MAMTIEDKLGCDRFRPDDQYSHIQVVEYPADERAVRMVVMGCPAQLYSYEDGKLTFNHEGCLECGTCRVVGRDKVVKSWNHPMGGMGVEFRMG